MAGCPNAVVDPDTDTIIADICHIRAQKPGGPRYDSALDDEERHGYDNLILLCKVHHSIIDDPKNIEKYTVEYLIEIKTKHEATARESGPELRAPDEVIKALILTATTYESGSVHLDLRDAVIKAGGEGGRAPGASGGGGGVVTIMGVTLPPAIAREISADLDGTPGQDYGSGGGGGGVLAFVGRPATESDVSGGLKVPLFFPANGATVADGLIYILGAGWEYYWVREFPLSTHISVAFMVDFGALDPNVLLGFEVTVKDPSGSERTLKTVDAEVCEPEHQINRRNLTAVVPITFELPGIYELGLCSGGIRFARYSFQVKLR